MSNISLINEINDCLFSSDDEKTISLLNRLLTTNNHTEFLPEIFMLISSSEMYGFLSYLSNDEKRMFYAWDNLKSSTYKGKTIPYYNRGQLSLLFDLQQNSKIFFSAPTSFGKTSLIVDFLIYHKADFNNVLFVVPTNSLLEELYQKLIVINKELSLNYKISTQPYADTENRNLLLLTPERFLLIKETVNSSFFDLIVMDETYKIIESRNNQISDFLNNRSLRFRKVADLIGASSNRAIFLSPFTYELKPSMELFLNKYNIKKINREIEYVGREIYDLSNSQGFKNAFPNNECNYSCDLSIPNKVNRVLDQLTDKQNIVYVSDYTKAYEIIRKVPYKQANIQNQRYLKFLKHLESEYEIENGFEWSIVSALKKGIGIYIAPLPRYIKREIVYLFDHKIINTLIVTSAFTEGVNTNASNLIFTTLINGPKTNKLSDIDVLNASGRAGRFGKNNVGKIYCLSPVVYSKVKELQDNSKILLENYNYKRSEKGEKKLDFEIEMIDDQFLSAEETAEKKQDEIDILELGLTKKDLSISLSVSLKWKLAVYKYIKDNNEIAPLFDACNMILNGDNDQRVASLDFVFEFLKKALESVDDNGFPVRIYDIRPFDLKGNFVWGRLYKVYCAGKTKDIIKNNVKYITSEFNKMIAELPFTPKNKKCIEDFFQKNEKSWLLKYFKDDLKVNLDAFYTETFKFISNIVQYKIPFYVSFLISILKLYIQKNNLIGTYDISKLDSKKAALLFEDGTVNDDYSSLVDYGIPNDLILKLVESNVTYSKLLDWDFDKSMLDDYELTILEEFVGVIK